jgi:hypothetical protein
MRSQRFIAFFLVLVTVLSMTAFNLPLVGKFYGIVGHHAVDSIDSVVLSEQDSMVPITEVDSMVPMSETDSLLLNLDSLKAQFDREHGIGEKKSGAVQWNDSVAAAEDSIKRAQKKSALEAPVVYTAKDSMTFFMVARLCPTSARWWPRLRFVTCRGRMGKPSRGTRSISILPSAPRKRISQSGRSSRNRCATAIAGLI